MLFFCSLSFLSVFRFPKIGLNDTSSLVHSPFSIWLKYFYQAPTMCQALHCILRLCSWARSLFQPVTEKIPPTNGGILFKIYPRSPPKPTIPSFCLTSDTEHMVGTHWCFLIKWVLKDRLFSALCFCYSFPCLPITRSLWIDAVKAHMLVIHFFLQSISRYILHASGHEFMSEVWESYLQQQQNSKKKKVLSVNRCHLYLASKSHAPTTSFIHSELFTENS